MVRAKPAALNTAPLKSSANIDSALVQSAPETHGFAQPGEAIRLSVYPDTASFVSGFYTIDGDGRIYLPLIGKRDVSSISEKAFLNTLKAVYLSYLQYPNLQVWRLFHISLL
jgi:protein involved in polysaccharide export with SLBB domain